MLLRCYVSAEFIDVENLVTKPEEDEPETPGDGD